MALPPANQDGVSQPSAIRPLTEGYAVKGGHNPGPSQIQTRPPPPGAMTPAPPSAIDRARKITAPFAGDEKLDAWAAKLIASADDFQKHRRSDPLAQFLVTHPR